MAAYPETIEEFCDWCTRWIRDGAGDAEGRTKTSWVVAGEGGVIYGSLPGGGSEESRYLAATELAEAVEKHSPEFFGMVLTLERWMIDDNALPKDERAFVIAAYSEDEERHLFSRDKKNWERVEDPGGAYTQIGREVAADWRRGARYAERLQVVASLESPLLNELADRALEGMLAPAERVAAPARLIELATDLAAALPKAKQKKLIRLASDYLEAWRPGSTASFDGADGRTTLVALLITQVASTRLDAAGLQSVVVDHARYGHVGVIHRDGLDLDSITDPEFEQLSAEAGSHV